MTSKDRLIEALEIIVGGLRLYGCTPNILELKRLEYIEIGEEALNRKDEDKFINADDIIADLQKTLLNDPGWHHLFHQGVESAIFRIKKMVSDFKNGDMDAGGTIARIERECESPARSELDDIFHAARERLTDKMQELPPMTEQEKEKLKETLLKKERLV